MLAKMIDKIVKLKETKIFEIDGQTYTDAALTRIPPHVDRPYSREIPDGIQRVIAGCKTACFPARNGHRNQKAGNGTQAAAFPSRCV